MLTNRSTPRNHESGSILLVSLIILVALSIMGSMALTTTHFELQLSRNDKVMTRLISRTTAVALATAQKLETLSGDVLGAIDWETDSRPPWLSRGTDDQYDDLSGNAFDGSGNKKTAILKGTLNPSTWVTPEDKAEGEDVVPTNSAVFSANKTIADETIKADFNEKFLNCKYQVIDVGVTSKSSLEIGNNSSSMHEYYVSGYCEDGPQHRIVQLGYRKKH